MSDQADQLRHEIAKEDEEIKEEDVHDHVVLVTGSDGKVKVQGEEEGKKESFLQKLHRSDSSSAGSVSSPDQ